MMGRTATKPGPIPSREPENMTAAIAAKCHAVNQKLRIKREMKELRAAERAWNKRLGQCLRAIGKFGAACQAE